MSGGLSDHRHGGVETSSAATPARLIFVWFSNNGRLAIIVFVAAVFLILFIRAQDGANL